MEPSERMHIIIDSFTRQYPELARDIMQCFFSEKDNLDLVTVYTRTQTLTVQYFNDTKRSVIIQMFDGVPEEIVALAKQEAKTIKKSATPKGVASGFFAMVLTVLYAFFILVYFRNVGMESLGGFVATIIVIPHMLCVCVAAVFSLVGLVGMKRWAMLTAGILLVASAVLMTMYAPMVLIQALLFFISYARMGSTE